MLIVCNQYRMRDENAPLSSDLSQAIIKTIDREPDYGKMVESLKQRYLVPANIELYVKCMKSIIQSTLFPH
jgi:hypothetical protein